METIPGNERPHDAPETAFEPGEDVREAPLPGGEEGIPSRGGREPESGSIEQASLAR